jgi:hypothetical protein
MMTMVTLLTSKNFFLALRSPERQLAEAILYWLAPPPDADHAGLGRGFRPAD